MVYFSIYQLSKNLLVTYRKCERFNHSLDLFYQKDFFLLSVLVALFFIGSMILWTTSERILAFSIEATFDDINSRYAVWSRGLPQGL